ncbi:probable dolichyl-diphosphooligosaccharide--protein glycosyltransferase subunit 3 [Andrographis paniculata]|uniref:probable dolichyl-diphosphooligosaccharide--protein glycosyltransferase subunit 3 n=1 Tax=Andrographis paniculata TaxID=175694 RepID=UPI0021E743E0|nr:probable dolichyl-diphosphooligosaccharide--protein glycosyltransferase subunit 3 [Andrographis paniculata]
MAISDTLILTAVVLIGLLSILSTYATADDSTKSILSQLSALQSKSPAGVIHLTDDLLRRITSIPAPRPFHSLVFFDARHLHSNPELPLPILKKEFSLVSSSFKSNNPNLKSQLYFFEIEFQESQASFAQFGVNTLPHLRLLPPSAADLKADSIRMDAGDFSRFAESLSEFIKSTTNFSVGPIDRPPVLSKLQIAILTVIFLISAAYFIKKLISGNSFLHDKTSWIAGAIVVYFFSVSGVMFNIIRGAPMFMVDRKDPSNIVYFYQGSGMQLGTEGFSVGFLYTFVGLLLAFVTHVLVKLRNTAAQRLSMLFVLFVSFWAVRNVILLDNWKTGYQIHGYWPSSWN